MSGRRLPSFPVHRRPPGGSASRGSCGAAAPVVAAPAVGRVILISAILFYSLPCALSTDGYDHDRRSYHQCWRPYQRQPACSNGRDQPYTRLCGYTLTFILSRSVQPPFSCWYYCCCCRRHTSKSTYLGHALEQSVPGRRTYGPPPPLLSSSSGSALLPTQNNQLS